jgi:hypothetical protein
MQERPRIGNRTQQRPGPAGLGDVFGGGNGDRANATVSSGIHVEQLPVAGMSVGAIRQRFASRLEIAPGTLAFIAGHPVDEDTVIGEGELVSFMRASGEKG